MANVHVTRSSPEIVRTGNISVGFVRNNTAFVLCASDRLYTLVEEGGRTDARRKEAMFMGERTRSWGLPRKIRGVHGQARWLLLDPVRTLQEVYQGASAETRATKVARTLVKRKPFNSSRFGATCRLSTVRRKEIYPITLAGKSALLVARGTHRYNYTV